MLTRFRTHLFTALLGAAAVCGPSARADDVAPAVPGAELRVFLVTLGPGSHPFFKFGHNAIWIEDTTRGPESSRVYNFGTFAFDSPALIPKFIRGRFMYWLSVAGIEETILSYQAADRSIVAQELDLTPAEKRMLKTRLDENARPENREYLYDYFLDNCSTRVRDAIDAAVGGAVRAGLSSPSQQTFRQHALRLTADVPWEYVALHFGLSGTNDRLRDRWAEGFIPEVLQASLRSVRLPAGDGWLERPLVKSERVIFSPTRAPPLDRPPNRGVWFLFTGTALGALFFGFARLASSDHGGTRTRTRTLARAGLGLLLTLVGLVTGILGTFLLFVWAGTNHRAGFANENLFLTPPWLLGLVGIGPAMAFGARRATRAGFLLLAATLATSVLGVLCKALPPFVQDNTAFLLFFIPLWTGALLGVRRLANRVTS